MLLIAGSIRNISGYALGAWMPTFFVREHRDFDMTAKDFAVPVGLAVLFGGGAGCFLGVLLAPTPKFCFGLVALAYVTA